MTETGCWSGECAAAAVVLIGGGSVIRVVMWLDSLWDAVVSASALLNHWACGCGGPSSIGFRGGWSVCSARGEECGPILANEVYGWSRMMCHFISVASFTTVSIWSVWIVDAEVTWAFVSPAHLLYDEAADVVAMVWAVVCRGV